MHLSVCDQSKWLMGKFENYLRKRMKLYKYGQLLKIVKIRKIDFVSM